METVVIDTNIHLSGKKRRALTLVRYAAFQARKSLIGSYDTEERYGWAQKAKLAEKALSGDQAAIDLLNIECAARGDGVTHTDLAQKIIEKAAAFSAAELFIRGTQTRLQKAVEAAESIEQLETIEAELQTAFTLPNAQA